MNLGEEELKRIIAGGVVGGAWPYNSNSERQVEDFLKQVVADLNRSPNILAEAEFDHYGSGYASYVDVFCYKRGGRSTVRKGETDWIEGVSVYLSRHAPVAVYGPNEKTKHARGGSYGFLSADLAGSLPEGEWQEVEREILTKLKKHGLEVANKQTLSRLLGFEARIPTILNNGSYLVFDALFYWED